MEADAENLQNAGNQTRGMVQETPMFCPQDPEAGDTEDPRSKSWGQPTQPETALEPDRSGNRKCISKEAKDQPQDTKALSDRPQTPRGLITF